MSATEKLQQMTADLPHSDNHDLIIPEHLSLVSSKTELFYSGSLLILISPPFIVIISYPNWNVYTFGIKQYFLARKEKLYQ
jgi:hypothetical protein